MQVILDKVRISKELAKVLGVIFIGNLFYGLSVGMYLTLTPLFYSSHGLSKTIIGGLMAMDLFASFIVTPFIPRLARKYGMVKVLIVAAIIRNIALALLPWGASIPEWFVLMAMFGTGGFTLFVGMQYWVNSICSVENRGIGLASVNLAFSLGIAFGALVLKFIGLHGKWPFFLAAMLSFIAFIPYSFVFKTLPHSLVKPTAKIWHVIESMPSAIAGGIFADYIFFALASFVVLYGVNSGMDEKDAALLITYFLVAGVIIDLPTGFVVDRIAKFKFFLLGGTAVLIAIQFLPVMIYFGPFIIIMFMLFCFGDGGTYVASLSMLGEKFKDNELIAANSAFAMMNSVGGVVGLLFTGFLMDIFGPKGLVISISSAAVIFLVTVNFFKLREKKRGERQV